MNRPNSYPATESVWEDGAEAAFFDTLEPPPVRDDLMPPQADAQVSYTTEEVPMAAPSSATPEPIDFRPEPTAPTLAPVIDDDESAEVETVWAGFASSADDDEVVRVVTPAWVWPTVALLALMAVAGTSFGLGALAMSSAVSVEAPPVQAASLSEVEAAAPPVAEEPAVVAAPTVVPTRPTVAVKKKRTVKKRAKTRSPKVDAPSPTTVQTASIPGLAPVAAPSAPPKATPSSVADLPAAVSLGQLKPGAAL